MLIPLDAVEGQGPYDCCVVGAGPAGIALSLDLAARGRRVLLCEGGGFDIEPEAQAMFRAEVIGDPYHDLSYFRTRAFGGTTAMWGGWCRPLDAIDFEPKPHHPLAHWPIRREDLDPFLPAALKLVEVDAFPPDEPVGDSGLQRFEFRWSPPTRFGEAYRAAVVENPTIFLCLNANALRVAADDRRVTGVVLADFGGRRAVAAAETYVVAAGGIENSRLLLWSNETSNGRVVKRADALGRYWMDHPTFTIGEFVAFRETDGVYFSLTPERQRALGLLNCSLRFYRHPNAPLAEMLDDLGAVAPELAAWARPLIGRDDVHGGHLQASWEQEPRAENRVALSDRDVDRFGAPLSVLRWTKSGEDLITMQRTALIFCRHLAETNIGRVRLRDWALGLADYPLNDDLTGNHHMGGTRMADSPALGVVDANLKVHGQPNLYVAGSSTFPSGGYANPTVTILQLALRLAAHIDAGLPARG
ncbi:MAG: GMC family oxidoreductase [Rhodobacteraceae bacterium]|nr:MAG: GMC family oxidoreductase [Paracoccaceae bacterium]